MKRIFLLLAIVGITAFQSCSSDDDAVVTDNDTIALVFDVTASFNSNGEIVFPFETGEVYPGDGVLVYWMESTVGGNPVWRPVPQTVYFPNNEYPGLNGFITYNYDFTTTRTRIFLETDSFGLIPNYTQSQIFRIVVVPGSDPIQVNGRAVNQSTVDVNDYNAVVKAYGIKESNVIKR